jgi:hypothetical protein
LKATGQVIGPRVGLNAPFASLLAAIGLLLVFTGAGAAGESLEGAYGYSRPALRHHYRRAPAVRGYLIARRIGYSYAPEDVINTYGLTRNLFGATNSYRDLSTDRQTPSGPFDSRLLLRFGNCAPGRGVALSALTASEHLS